MANIAGGVVAGSALEGQKDYRMAEAQNIQNQSHQLDLDERNDAHRAYTQAMDAWSLQRKQKKASEQAQVQPTESALGTPAPPAPEFVQQAPDSADVGAAGSLQAAAPQSPPQATEPAPSALTQTNAPAPAAPSATSPAPAATSPAPAQEDGFMQKITKALGIEPQVLSDVPRTPGAMKGLMAAQQHVEQFQKQEIQQDINQMFRANVTKSEPEQMAAAVKYGQTHGIPGAPNGFEPVEKDGQVVGWKALHDSDQVGGMIPNMGNGFLDSYTRVLYGAVDRMGSIGASIEAETKLAPEKVKAKSALDVQGVKNEGYKLKAENDYKKALDVAKEQNKGRVAAASISASGRKAQEGVDDPGSKQDKIDAATVEGYRKSTQKTDPLGRPIPVDPQVKKDADAARKRMNARRGITEDSAPAAAPKKDFKSYVPAQ